MKLEIKHIKDGGTSRERVVLVANESVDIGDFLLFSTEVYEGGKFSSSVTNPYWFPDKTVSANDLIILYTKEGETSQKSNSSGTTSYFFYRNLKIQLFSTKSGLLLLEAKDWLAHVDKTGAK